MDADPAGFDRMKNRGDEQALPGRYRPGASRPVEFCRCRYSRQSARSAAAPGRRWPGSPPGVALYSRRRSGGNPRQLLSATAGRYASAGRRGRSTGNRAGNGRTLPATPEYGWRAGHPGPVYGRAPAPLPAPDACSRCRPRRVLHHSSAAG